MLNKIDTDVISGVNQLTSLGNKIDTDVLSCCAQQNSSLNQIDYDVISTSNLLASLINKTDADVNSCCTTQTSLLNKIDADVISTSNLLASLIIKTDSDLLSCCSQVNSKLDTLIATSGVSGIAGLQSGINTIISLVNQTDADVNSCCTAQTSLLNKIDTDVISGINQLTSLGNKIDTDVVSTSNFLQSLINKTDSDLLSCCSQVNSKLDTIIASSATSGIASIQSDINTLISLVNKTDADVNSCCTAQTSLLNKIDTDIISGVNQLTSLSNKIDTDVISTSNVLQSLINKTDADINSCCVQVNSTLGVINSKIDLLDSCTIPITEAQFTPTYTINSPGSYKFVQNIVASPPANTPAIFINSSSVILDLSCFSLTQGNATVNVDGIFINSNLQNVTITGGLVVSNFTGNGINSPASVNVGENINITNMSITNCALFGLQLISTNNSSVSNLRIYACGNSANTVTGGVSLNTCTDLNVNNITIDQCGNTAGSNSDGIFLNGCTNCTMDSILVKNILVNNASTNCFLTQTGGNNIFSNCKALGNFNLSANFLVGFNIVEPNDTCINCQVSNLSISGNIQTYSAQTSASGTQFIDCEVSNCTVTGASTGIAGFSFSNTQIIAHNCKAFTLSAPNNVNAQAVIYFLIAGISIQLINCIINGNQLQQTNSVGFSLSSLQNSFLKGCIATSVGIGFNISNCANCTLTENQACQNITGFSLAPLADLNNSFSKNLSSKNTTNYSQFPVGSTQAASNIQAINESLTSPWTNAAIS